MSRLLLGLAQQIASNGDSTEINVPAIAQAIHLKADSAFTLGNVLGLYLLYWPVMGSVTKFTLVVQKLFNDSSSTIQEVDLNLDHPLDTLEANIMDDRIVRASTDDLIYDTHEECLKLGFDTNCPNKATLVKAFIYLQNHSTAIGTKFKLLLDLVTEDGQNDQEFDRWVRCVFEPYAIAQTLGSISLSFTEFSQLHFEDQFSVLAEGLSGSNPSLWLQKVILPFLDSNISPLIQWLFTLRSLGSHYQLWSRCLVTTVESTGRASVRVRV